MNYFLNTSCENSTNDTSYEKLNIAVMPFEHYDEWIKIEMYVYNMLLVTSYDYCVVTQYMFHLCILIDLEIYHCNI